MPRATGWIILVIVAIVLLSPLCEFFDKTDQWSQDGSDFVFYILCLFCFLGLSLRRTGVIGAVHVVFGERDRFRHLHGPGKDGDSNAEITFRASAIASFLSPALYAG